RNQGIPPEGAPSAPKAAGDGRGGVRLGVTRALTRLELVEALLYSYMDARLPFRDVDGGPEGNRDSRLLLMSRDWNQGSYAELERVLGLMRERRLEQLNGHALGYYRRQVLDWYMAPVKISHRPVWVTVHGVKRTKKLNETG